MSFTEDELQAFNTILEQRFTAHRNEMEQFFDLRIANWREQLEQRLVTLQENSAG